MIGGGEGECGAEMLVKCLPKGTCKAGVTVGDDGLGESMEFENVREKESGESRSVDIGGGGDEVAHLGEAVHYGEDGVMALRGGWEGGDEVHGNAFPWLGWNWERLEQAGDALMTRLHHLALMA
jgi:hypothetical protein